MTPVIELSDACQGRLIFAAGVNICEKNLLYKF